MARGGGVRPAVAKDLPLWEPPPPLPLPPAVPGPRQRKTKTRAEETAAGAPPVKPGQKARASRPRCLAAGGLALPGRVGAPCPGGPVRLPAPCLPPSFPPRLRPPPRAALAPDLARPATSRRSWQPCPKCPRRAPQAVPAQRGRCDPGHAASHRVAPGSALSPGPAPLPGGAGAPDGEGSRPGRRRLHSLGGNCGSAARAPRRERAGPGGAGPEGAGPSAEWVPPGDPAPSLLPLRSRRGLPAASP